MPDASPIDTSPDATMPHYLVAIHRPGDYDPFMSEDEAMRRAVQIFARVAFAYQRAGLQRRARAS